MILKLQITTNVKGDVFELVLKKSKYRVGRRFDNDLRIKETYVSAYHAEIHKDKDENYTLLDKDSSNGTFVNGNRVQGPKAVPIREGDYIKFGMLKVKVARFVDTGPKVVALGERDSGSGSSAPTQPLKTTKPVPSAPKPGATVSEKTGPFPSAKPFSPSTSKVATVAEGKESNEDKVAALAVKLAAVEKERDTFEKKIKSLEKRIQQEKDEAQTRLKKRQDSSEGAAKEVTRITKEFASKEGYLTAEISKLKKELEAAEEESAKAKIVEESKAKSDQVAADLQSQVEDLKKAQKVAEEVRQKLSSEAEILAANLAREKAEKEKLSSSLKEKIAAAATAAALVSKIEKSQLQSSAAGEKEAGKLRQQIADLKSQVESEAAARKKIERDNQDRIKEWGLADKERATLEENYRGQIKQLELDLKTEQTKATSASFESKKVVAEIAALNDRLAEVKSRLEDSEKKNSTIQKEAEEAKAAIGSKLESVKTADSRIKTLEADLQKEKESAASLASCLEKKESLLSEQEQKLSQQTTLAATADEEVIKSQEKILALRKSLQETREELEAKSKEQDGEGAAVAALSVKLAAIEIERDTFQGKIAELEKEIQQEKEKAREIQHQRKASSENDAKEITRISHQFANREDELKSEIAELKRDLDSSRKEAAKAKIAEESKNKAEEVIADLQEQVAELKREQKLAQESREKSSRESESLLGKLGEQSTEKEKENAALKDRLHSIEEELKREREGREAETSDLKASLTDQKDRYANLEKLLKNTQEGLSGVLRNAWNQRDEQKALFQSDENVKLGEAEEALSKAIHSREELAVALEKLERKLVIREEKAEKLQDRIDELESRLGDNHHANGKLAEQVKHVQGELSSVQKIHLEEIRKLEARLQTERDEREQVGKEVEDAKERLSQFSETADATKTELEQEIIEWEKKYQRLKDQKASLTKETETLSDIEKAISKAREEKARCDAELAELSQSAKEVKNANIDLEKEHKTLQSKKTELDSGLQVARSELNNVQKRCRETRSQEEKLTLRIGAAEKRVQALKHLEIELEQAIDRKRGSEGLSRKDVFSPSSGESAAVAALNGATTEEAFCRKLISKLDLLDDLTVRYGNKWRYPKVSEQLTILKGSFLDLLKEHSVDQFQVKPGTVLSIEERKRIKLIHSKDEKLKKPFLNGNGGDDGQPRVVNTLRPGYIYQNGGNSVIIRKAEVVVA